MSWNHELEEQKNMLYCYNEKIDSAKLILNGWEKVFKEIREEVIETSMMKIKALQNLVYEFKQNDKVYLEDSKYS